MYNWKIKDFNFVKLLVGIVINSKDGLNLINKTIDQRLF